MLQSRIHQEGIFEYIDSENQLITLDYSNSNFSGYANLNTVARFKNNFNAQAFIEYQFPS